MFFQPRIITGGQEGMAWHIFLFIHYEKSCIIWPNFEMCLQLSLSVIFVCWISYSKCYEGPDKKQQQQQKHFGICHGTCYVKVILTVGKLQLFHFHQFIGVPVALCVCVCVCVLRRKSWEDLPRLMSALNLDGCGTLRAVVGTQ